MKKNGFSLIKLLISCIIIVFMLLFIMWIVKKNLSSFNLNPLLDGIFRDNINSMQDAGEAYFTTDRLPKELNQEVKLTLQELLDKNYILPFTDKNGKECSLNDSYVSVVKTTDGYELRTFLKCSDESHQLVKVLGCHNLCEGDSCNKSCSIEKITQYQFVKTSKVTKNVYSCTSGTLDGKNCIITDTDTKEAKTKENSNTDIKTSLISLVKVPVDTTIDKVKVDDKVEKNIVGYNKVYTDLEKKVETSCTTEYVKDPNCKVKCVPTYINGVLEDVCNTCGYVEHKSCTDTDVWVCPNGYTEDSEGTKCYKEEPVYEYSCLNKSNSSGSGESLKCWHYVDEKVCPNGSITEGKGNNISCYKMDSVPYCTDGYTLKDKSCYKTTYTYEKYCDKGYDLVNNSCIKTTPKTVKADVTKKEETKKVYKWSKEETLEGWVRTGKTKEILGKEVCDE